MSRSPAPRVLRVLTVLSVLLAVLFGSGTARASEDDVLGVLLNGTAQERLRAADDVSSILQHGVLYSGAGDPRSIDDMVDSLIHFLRLETDDWISRALLDSLVWDDNPALNRLYRAALDSGSVNLNAMGIRHFTLRTDPDAVEALESLWERGVPSWVRPELIRALAEHGSATYLAEFMRLARDDDPDVREAAIEALGTLAREEAIPVLRRLARDGTREDQEGALEALGAFPKSDEAFAAVMHAGQEGEQAIKATAVRTLGRFGRPEADALLIAWLEEPDGLDLRVTIARALADSEHPDATAALVRLLHQPDVTPASWIASVVVNILHNRDDPDAVPGLRDLAGTQELIDYLSRDRSDGDRTIIVTTSCSFGAPISPDDPRAWRVAPPPPFETIRCWAGPDLPGDPDDDERIVAGTLVRITDHFEARDASWVEIAGNGADSCWVPMRALEKGSATGTPVSWPRRHVRHEFDIATSDLDSTRVVRLAEAGLLEVFDPGPEISAAALEIDRTDADQIALLAASISDLESSLDTAIESILGEIQPPEEGEDGELEQPGAAGEEGGED
jgi:HEAT repeat protein